MNHTNMAIKRWRTLHTYLIFLILYSCKIDIPCVVAAELSSLSAVKPSTKDLLDKYKCDQHVSTKNRGIYNTPSFNTLDNSISSTNGTKLNCSTSQLSYRNVTEDEFVRGIQDNGVLEVISLPRKLEPRTFCIAGHNVDDGPASAAAAIVRIAMCDESLQPEHSHHHDHHKDNEIDNSTVITLKKCCESAYRLEKRIENGKETFKCMAIPTGGKWEPAIFNSTNEDYSKHKDLDEFPNVDITSGFPKCYGTPIKSLNNSKDIWFMVLTSGVVEIGLKFWFKPVWLPVQDNEFCLDEVLDHDPSLHNEIEINSHGIYHKNQILLYCNIDSFDDYLFHRRLFGGMCVAAAGIVFILLIIYVAIWDKQNLAGWTQFNIFVALFFVVLMEGLRTLFDADALQVRSTTTCVIVAAIAQYFFFALNTTWSVMCFDLFYMFWKLETTSKTVARYRNRLFGYLLFSWGLPLVVVCLAFYLTHHTATEEMDEMKGVYAFAHRRCSSPIRKLGFQTQGIMFLLNLIFFFLTTLLIWKHRRGLNTARKNSRNERHTWRSVCLFMKLVIVMGVSSLTIPFDYFFVSSAPLSPTAICFRMVHFIPFFAVLFIFGFNEKNMILISQKYPRVGKYFGFVACTSGATASDTVNHSRSGNANRTSDHPSTST